MKLICRSDLDLAYTNNLINDKFWSFGTSYVQHQKQTKKQYID